MKLQFIDRILKNNALFFPLSADLPYRYVAALRPTTFLCDGGQQTAQIMFDGRVTSVLVEPHEYQSASGCICLLTQQKIDGHDAIRKWKVASGAEFLMKHFQVPSTCSASDALRSSITFRTLTRMRDNLGVDELLFRLALGYANKTTVKAS